MYYNQSDILCAYLNIRQEKKDPSIIPMDDGGGDAYIFHDNENDSPHNILGSILLNGDTQLAHKGRELLERLTNKRNGIDIFIEEENYSDWSKNYSSTDIYDWFDSVKYPCPDIFKPKHETIKPVKKKISITTKKWLTFKEEWETGKHETMLGLAKQIVIKFHPEIKEKELIAKKAKNITDRYYIETK